MLVERDANMDSLRVKIAKGWGLQDAATNKISIAIISARRQNQLCRQASVTEPIREVWIHEEWFSASRPSMMRIMARRINAATVVA
jgi:hypothetical protein